MRESITAVVARGDTWSGVVASEPYDVAWASEAVVFLRSLGAEGHPEQARAWIQISPDGMSWIDEGSMLPIPRVDEIASVRLSNFGTYLRVMTVLPEGSSFKALLTLSLKE